MTHPFNSPGGFGFVPFGREEARTMFRQARQGRRDLREQLRAQVEAAREQGVDPTCQTGFGFDPRGGRGFGFGFGPGGLGGPMGGPFGGHRGRGVLTLLAERPMHGYEMTQEIASRSNNLWKPSPGSVYPTLQLLVDEGLIVPTESEGSKKTFELTEEGRQAAAEIQTPPWAQIAEDADPAALNLHSAVSQLMVAVTQSSYAAGEDQQQRILDVVNNARREIYQILGEE
ncbi:PadR family transcriptional regulator [Mycolicibacterium boenickei]|uniref:PadR family transcriptional regulator n=1 Tax=Mycolicibacterium boenickei TaxID=146017 RepID=UPI00098B915E|nr:PadR family transcriptional regulator [Mycolicibacterium boenickei]